MKKGIFTIAAVIPLLTACGGDGGSSSSSNSPAPAAQYMLVESSVSNAPVITVSHSGSHQVDISDGPVPIQQSEHYQLTNSNATRIL